MYLKDLMQGEKFAFYAVIKKLVFIDGTFSDEEQALVNGFLEEMQLEESQIREIGFEDAVDMISYSSPSTRRKVFIELVGVALCDEVFDVSERDFLNNISRKFGISEEEKGRIIQTVRELLSIYRKMAEIVDAAQ